MPCERADWFYEWELPDGSVTNECPVNLIDADTLELLDVWFPHYKNGVLPVAGGLLDQSNWYIEAMTEINKWIARARYADN